MSWYVRKTTKPQTLDQTIYYSFEKKETPNQTNKKTTKDQNQNKTQKQEKQKQPKKRKETSPTDTIRPAKEKKNCRTNRNILHLNPKWSNYEKETTTTLSNAKKTNKQMTFAAVLNYYSK